MNIFTKSIFTKRVLAGIGVALAICLVAALLFVQNVLYIGTGYAAKRLCSEIFLAHRAEDEIKSVDLALLPTSLDIVVDKEAKVVTVTSFGMAKHVAVWRKGLGCALSYGSTPEALRKQGFEPKALAQPLTDGPWPLGTGGKPKVMPTGVDLKKLESALDFAFLEPEPKNLRRTRAVLVVYDGKLVAERYAKGFDKDMPLLSWSMAKSVMHALIGVLVKQGKLDITKPAPVPEWQEDPDDPRQNITTDHLLRMSSGLDFDEDYGAFGDATKMLFASKSVADFAASRTLAHKPGMRWHYSSGDTNMLSHIIRHVLKDDSIYHSFPRRELFAKIGAASAVFETDPLGTFVGSSFVYMTARDWARFGLLYMQGGVWNGLQVLPKGWTKAACTLTPGTPLGEYGAQWWLNRGVQGNPKHRPYSQVPLDYCAAQGFETQRVIVIPSRKTVIVRLGLTRKRGAFDTNAFVQRVLKGLPNH